MFIQETNQRTSPVPSTTQMSVEEEEVLVFPTSFAQERLWFLDQLEPNSPFYNMAGAVRLTGDLNIEALENSFAEIIGRHEILRTTFETEEGKPVQVIHPPEPFTFNIIAPSPLAREGWGEGQVQRLITEETQRPFDLSTGRLIRASLFKLSDTEHILMVNMHHIVSDGWSIGVFIKELAILYEAFINNTPSPLPELPIQYADFAHWQREYLKGEVLEKQLNYWKEKLQGIPDLLELPTDHPRPPVQTYHGSTFPFSLSPSLSQQLKELSEREGVTLFMTLLSAFQTLLHRYSHQEDICVGSPIANRTRAEIESLIGFFVNTLVFRSNFSDNLTFKELLHQVKGTAFEAYAHQDLPFEQVVEALQPKRSLSYSPIFQVMFVLQNLPMGELKLPGLFLGPMKAESGIAKFDLTLEMEEESNGLSGSIEYNTDLFNRDTIGRMLGHFQTLLDGIINNPDQEVSSLPILSEGEKQKVLIEWNNTKRDYPKDKCVHQLFEEQVEKSPDNVAVIFQDQQLTYRELNTKTNQLAHYLRKLGVGPETFVGISVERSLEMVIGLLGILKAGGAYVPLDPNYPKDRLSFMLEDTQAKVLLTQKKLANHLPEHQAKVICLDADWKVISQENDKNPPHEAQSENLAYIIYTSGSTGKPKGVAIRHRNTVTLIYWARETFTPQELSGVLASTSLAFDLSVFELFVTLSWGFKVILAENALQLPSLKAANQVTLVNTVPSAITELIRVDGIPSSVRTVNLAGEPLKTGIVNQLYQKRHIEKVYDLYGPSEDTTYSTFALREPEKPPTIGHPIANTQVYILDRKMNPLPIGVSGEIYISGEGLARGYLKRPELTEEKFISNPFGREADSRLYKTGDLARYLPDGNIEFLGRIDHQVKIRGFRIELGEIESSLAQHPNLKEIVVIAREDTPGDKRLVAYLVVKQEPQPTISELRDFLKKSLPDYMIPSAFVFLEKMPLTPNGKIDRKALPPPEETRADLGKVFVPPRDSLELEVSRIWEEVLNVQPVGVRDNFFELGGHSLLAVRLMTKIQQKTGRSLPLTTLFEAPTVEHLASVIRQKGENVPQSSLVAIQPQGSKKPLFFVHPVGGNVFCYYELSHALGHDQPLYGLQAQGLNGIQTPYGDIPSMATRYIQEIQTVQPKGPYLLGGWSMGGVIAFEMAQQLKAKGENVASVVFIDSWAEQMSGVSEEMDENSLIADLFLNDIAGQLGENSSFSREDFQKMGLQDQEKYLLDQAKNLHLLPPDAELSQVRPLITIFKSNLRALSQYSPEKYEGPAVLLRAAESPAKDMGDPTLGWGTRISGIEATEIPGDHYTMLQGPNLQTLAEKLKACLEEASRGF